MLGTLRYLCLTRAVPDPAALLVEQLPGAAMFEETDHGDVVLSFQDQVFLFLVGEIDIASGPRLLALTRSLLASGASMIVLDLSAVSFLDCVGLRELITIKDRLVSAGRLVAVPSPSITVSRLLEQTSMTHFVTTVMTPAPLLSV